MAISSVTTPRVGRPSEPGVYAGPSPLRSADDDLLGRARMGDQAAMGALLDDTAARMRSIAFSILRDRDLAEDATQQALIGVWRGLGGLRDPAKYDAWSWRLVANACHRELRRGRRASPRALASTAIEPSFASELDLVADRDSVDRAFRRLPVKQRAVVALHHHQDLTVERVAEVLQVPVGTVQSRLHRAMDGLRAMLDAEARLGIAQTDGATRAAAATTPARRVRPWSAGIVRELSVAAGRRIVVAQDGSGDAGTIAGAVRMAEDGDLILVRPGVYHESIVVERDVIIVGDGKCDEVVVDFHGLPERATVVSWFSKARLTAPFGFWLRGSGATVANLAVRGPNDSIAFVVDGGAPTIRSVRTTLDGVWAGVGRFRHFLYMVGGATGRIMDCSAAAHVHVEGGSSPVIEHNEFGAALFVGSPGTAPVMRDNSLVVRSRARWCLGIGWGAAPIVERNDLSWVDGPAIDIFCWGSAAVVRDNVIRDSRIGIGIMNGAEATIERNDVDARTHGIVIHNADPTVIANTVRGLRAGGIVITGGGRPILEQNAIDLSSVSGGPAAVRDARPVASPVPVGAGPSSARPRVRRPVGAGGGA